jgi:hypothetical protein
VLLGEIAVPIRSADRIEEDLWIDPEDIEDLVREVAERSRHSLVNVESNPYYSRVETVGDLVRFVTLQPRLADDRTRPR